jgi:hypothetical protein
MDDEDLKAIFAALIVLMGQYEHYLNHVDDQEGAEGDMVARERLMVEGTLATIGGRLEALVERQKQYKH